MIKSYNPESLLMIVVYDCGKLIVQAPVFTNLLMLSLPLTGHEP